jgi:DNA-binding transcriptional MerR regulator
MSQVATLTGVKSHTLRVWERRYSFLKPSRTATNIRFYSDAEVRKLLNISILLNNNYRISKINN